MKPLSPLARDNIVGFVLLAILIVAAAMASTYGERSRLVPLVVSVGSIALLVLQLILQNRGASLEIDQEELLAGHGMQAVEEAEHKLVAERAEAAPHPDAQRQVVSYKGGSTMQGLLIVAAYAALIGLIGVLPAVFVFVFSFFLFISKIPLGKSFLLAAITEAGIYVLFVLLLNVPMNSGYLIDLLT